MSDQEPTQDQLEHALMRAFSNDDSFEFSERISAKISKAVYLRYLTLATGWLIGMTTFILSYPLLGKILELSLLQASGGEHQTLLTHFVLWLIPFSIVLFFTIGPLLLSRKRTPL